MTEPLTRRQVAGVLLATHATAFGIGYKVAPKEQLDKEAHHTGYFQVDVQHILSTTIESLREENKLLVLSYKGTATVQADRTILWLLHGSQVLMVPAVVNYYVDMADLSLADVIQDEKAKLVRVRLPALTIGDIAFQPEQAMTVNGGILTLSDDQVEALRKANYRSARRAMIAQAQQPALLNAARRKAIADVESYFTIPLRVAGQPDIKVAATFE